MSIFLTDAGKFQVEETGEGFLKGIVTISRAGVFDYEVDGKPVRKAKLPKDLFSKTAIDSVRGKPVTDGHPVDNSTGKPVLVTPLNHDKLSMGNVSEPWIDGEEIKAREIIYDQDLIDDIMIRKAKREVSIGFMTDNDESPGVYNGEQYDSVQTNIRVNHVAHVEAGRAGPQCSLHVDMKEGPTMLKFRTDEGKEIEIDGANATPIHTELLKLKTERDAEVAKVTEADEKVKGLEAQIVELKKEKPEGDEIKTLKEELGVEKDKAQTAIDQKDALTKQIAETDKKRPAEIRQAAKERAQLEADAKAAGIENVDSMDDRQVNEQIIAASLPYEDGVNVDEKTDEQIGARKDAAMELLRVKANEAPTGDGAGGGEVATDAEIAKKREGLKNLHTSKKKKD